jgi:hypothetical protein
VADGVTAPVIPDTRSSPAFEEAYDMVCRQTLDAAARVSAGGADLVAVAGVELQTLRERLAAVEGRPDLWDAADPLVVEHAAMVGDDLQAIVDGVDTDTAVFMGTVAVLGPLCEDWSASD